MVGMFYDRVQTILDKGNAIVSLFLYSWPHYIELLRNFRCLKLYRQTLPVLCKILAMVLHHSLPEYYQGDVSYWTCTGYFSNPSQSQSKQNKNITPKLLFEDTWFPSILLLVFITCGLQKTLSVGLAVQFSGQTSERSWFTLPPCKV